MSAWVMAANDLASIFMRFRRMLCGRLPPALRNLFEEFLTGGVERVLGGVAVEGGEHAGRALCGELNRPLDGDVVDNGIDGVLGTCVKEGEFEGVFVNAGIDRTAGVVAGRVGGVVLVVPEAAVLVDCVACGIAGGDDARMRAFGFEVATRGVVVAPPCGTLDDGGRERR